MRKVILVCFLLSASSAGCALLGYGFDGYGPADTGAGGASSTRAAGSSASTMDPSGSSTVASGIGGMKPACNEVRFAPRVDAEISSPPVELCAGDVAGEGHSDVVTVNAGLNSMSILRNTEGRGSLAILNEYFFGQSLPVALALGSFNSGADTRLDIALANQGAAGISILTNAGGGAFGPSSELSLAVAPTAIASADIDLDGYTDLVVAGGGNVLILSGNGTGAFVPASMIGPVPEAYDLAIAELNDDKRLDFVLTGAVTSTVTVLRSADFGYFQDTYVVGGTPRNLAIGDFDQNGGLDIAVASATGNAGALLLGSGKGTFATPPRTLPFGLATTGIAAADFDGSGTLDLAASADGAVVVLLGKGDGTFVGAELMDGLPGEPPLVAVDLDGNNRPDLVEGSSVKPAVGVFLNLCAQ